jgi:hypothetical protein
MSRTDELSGDLRNSKFYGTARWRAVVDDPKLDAEAAVAWLYCVTKAGGVQSSIHVTPEEVGAAVARNAPLVASIKAGGGRRKPR